MLTTFRYGNGRRSRHWWRACEAAAKSRCNGDAWCQAHIPPLLALGAIVIVTFDEGSSLMQRKGSLPGRPYLDYVRRVGRWISD
jgi:hypothetical protein